MAAKVSGGVRASDEGRGGEETGEGRRGEEESICLFFAQACPDSALLPSSGGRRRGDPLSADREDLDTVIEDVAKGAAAEAEKTSARGAVEDATEGPGVEAGKATTEEAGKGPAGEADASNTRAPVEGEVFDDEVLAAAGLEIVDKPSAGGDGSQEERLLNAMGTSFRKLEALHRTRLDKAKSRMAVAEKAEADLQKHAQETAEGLDAAAEAARTQHRAALNSQEEDLAKREADLDAKLRGKDREVEKLVLERTRELEQRHKEALDAQLQVHAGKVKELEVERDKLKEKALKLSQ
nr:uncharacterized protein LOC109736990 [Aegilops tauschii subsp. strangulata]